MSNTFEISARLLDGRLTAIEPLSGRPPIRTLYVSTSVRDAILTGPWANQEIENRLRGDLRADLDSFVTCALMRVSLSAKVFAAEDMKRLTDVYEVWTFKSRNRRQIRVFGRFAGYDMFFATNWQWRDTLGNNKKSPQWKAEIKKCQDEWRSLFSILSPHTGDDINEYLSVAEDVGIYY